jgi:hypothetical protein
MPEKSEFEILDNLRKLLVANDKLTNTAISYLCLNDVQRILTEERAYNAVLYFKMHLHNPDIVAKLEVSDNLLYVIVEVFKDYIKDFRLYVCNNEYIIDLKECYGIEKVYRTEFRFVQILLFITWCLSSRSNSFSTKFHKAGGTKALIEYLAEENLVKNTLNLKYEKQQAGDNSPPGLYFMRAIIGAVNNLSKLADDFQKDFLDMNATSVLLKLIPLINDLPTHRISTYMAIANIVSDKEIETLPEVELVVADIVKLIQTISHGISAKHKNIRSKYEINGEKVFVYVVSIASSQYHVVELLEVLYRVAVNDKIKTVIYKDYGCKQYLKNIFLNGNTVEREYTIKLLWQLCFNEEISNDVKNDHELMSFIEKISKNEDNTNSSRLKKYADGLLWSCHNSSVPRKPSSLVTEIIPDSFVVKELKKKEVHQPEHVMISYNRESRGLCLKIKSELEKIGLKVWIDVENIHGSSLDAMATAIEQSTCILVCMTEKYKQSPNCRAVFNFLFFSFLLNKQNYSVYFQGS